MKFLITERQYKRLIESREDDLMKKYQTRFPKEILRKIFSNPFMTKTNYKYADFLLKHLNSDYTFEMVQGFINLLEKFDRVQSQLERKDISSYKGISDLTATVNDYLNKHEKPKSKKIYEDDKFIVIEPQNFAASCKYGANTRWCTTEKGNPQKFNVHTIGNQGLYYVISKGDIGRNLYKIAFHFDLHGNLKIFDAADNMFEKSQLLNFKSTYPEMWNAIKSYYNETEHPDTTWDTITEGFELAGSIPFFIKVGDNEIKSVLQFKSVRKQGNRFLGNIYLKIYDSTDQPILLDEYKVFITLVPKIMDEQKGFDFNFRLESGNDKPRLNLELENVSGGDWIMNRGPEHLIIRMYSVIKDTVNINLKKNQKLLDFNPKEQ